MPTTRRYLRANSVVHAPAPQPTSSIEDGATGIGHEVFTTGSVFDENGLNVTSEFGSGYLGDFWVDLVPPRVNCSVLCAGFAASEIVIDEPAAGSSTMTGWYSAGDFSLSNVREAGSGYAFGSGASMDIGDCSDTDNSDASDGTDFVPLFSNVASIDDLDEDDWELGGDGFAGTDAGNDCYLGELRTLMDAAGNAADLSDPGAIPMQIQTLTALGVDRTAADLSNPQPAPAVTILNDVTLMFDALDADLGSGDPGSQVDETGCAALCTSIIATIDDGPGEDTAAILDLLDEHKAKATFFLIGERAEARPDDVKAISARGHQIGNHTFTHPARTFWMALPDSIKREITLTDRHPMQCGVRFSFGFLHGGLRTEQPDRAVFAR